MNPVLNLPQSDLKIKGTKIWDVLRKKYVNNTPEEWVRQHMIHYIIQMGYAKSLMQSEHLIKYNKMSKRCDIIVFDNTLSPLILVECKAPHIKLTEETFYQIAKYHFVQRAPLLILTNGLHHIYAFLNSATNEMEFLPEIPTKDELSRLRNQV